MDKAVGKWNWDSGEVSSHAAPRRLPRVVLLSHSESHASLPGRRSLSPPAPSPPPAPPAQALRPGWWGTGARSSLLHTGSPRTLLPQHPLRQGPSKGPPPFFLIPFLLLPLFLLTEDVNISWLRSLALNGARPPHRQWLCPQGGDGLVPKGPIGHREELRFGSK